MQKYFKSYSVKKTKTTIDKSLKGASEHPFYPLEHFKQIWNAGFSSALYINIYNFSSINSYKQINRDNERYVKA